MFIMVSPMQSLTLEHAAITPGYALHFAEERELAAHGEESHLEGVNFILLALEFFGGWGRDLIDNGRLHVQ